MAEDKEILDGKVTGITTFGAFVQLADGRTGLVHISEVSDQFVKDIKDFLREGQDVKVVLMTSLQEGKLRLSIKKATELLKAKGETVPEPVQRKPKPRRPERFETRSSEPFDPSKPPVDFYDRGDDSEESSSFDDRLSRFMKSSEERLSDLKKQTENKRGGGYVRRG